MKTVRVLKPYLHTSIGDVIEIRDQDAALLIPRGVVGLASDQPEEPKPAAKMTTRNIKTGKK